MTIQQLRYMIAVAEKGSITEAAKFLFLSQPSLSDAVRQVVQQMELLEANTSTTNRPGSGFAFPPSTIPFCSSPRSRSARCLSSLW